MKSLLNSRVLVTGLALSAAIASGCSSPDGPSGPTTGTVQLTLTRNGKPAVGVQTILQNSSDNSLIASGTGISDSNGLVSSTPFSGSARATFVDGSTNTSVLLTLEDIAAGSSFTVNLPLLAPATVGQVQYATPPLFAGANNYQVTVMASTSPTTNNITGTTPGTPLLINVTEDAPLPGGAVTVVAVAINAVGGVSTPVAYSVLSNVVYTPSPAAPTTTQSFGPWQTDFNDVSLRVSGYPAGFTPTYASAYMNQLIKGTFITQNPFMAPANPPAAPPLNYEMSLIPGISDSYFMFTNMSDSSNNSVYVMFSQFQSPPALTTWSPATSGLPLSTNIQLDPSSPSASPRFTWTQAGSATGISSAALIGMSWTTAGSNYVWYSFTNTESIDTTHAYQFPVLPAAYGIDVPPAGTSFTEALMVYADFSDIQADYATFLSKYNIGLISFQIPQGQYSLVNLVGTEGTP